MLNPFNWEYPAKAKKAGTAHIGMFGRWQALMLLMQGAGVPSQQQAPESCLT